MSVVRRCEKHCKLCAHEEVLKSSPINQGARVATLTSGDVLGEMETAAVQNDPEEMATLNLKFHTQLHMAANNPYLIRFPGQVKHAVWR